MMEKLDLRKDLKYLYQPGSKAPTMVDVPRMRFLAVEGLGRVGEEGSDFQQGVQAIFSLGYPLKFGAKKQLDIDYPVMPLEGLYWNADGGREFDPDKPRRMAWKLLMMVPDAISDDFVESTRADVLQKKDLPRLADLKVEAIKEGPSVQIMYVGPYDQELPTIERMISWAENAGFEVLGPHHEIYIGDPTRAAPEKLKTVLRYPVRTAE
jgi:hypothetical protein